MHGVEDPLVGHRTRRAIAIENTTGGCTEVPRVAKTRVIKELWQFLGEEKKYWLLPVVIVFALFGLVIVFAQTSVVAPFIYSLF